MTTSTKTGWSVNAFAEFWANPDPALVPALVTDDVVGHPGSADNVIRFDTAHLQQLLS